MDTNHSCATVRVSNLLAIQPFVSTEKEVRYYLNGTYITPHRDGGVVLVATDGHAMMIIYDRLGVLSGLPQIWRLDIKDEIARIYKSWRKENKDAIPAVDLWIDLHKMGSEERIRVFAMDQDRNLVGKEVAGFNRQIVIDGTFPEYWRVVPKINPKTTREPTVSIATMQMKRIINFADTFSTNKVPPMIHGGETLKDPAPVLFGPSEYGDEAMGVVMPFTTYLTAKEPNWVDGARHNA